MRFERHTEKLLLIAIIAIIGLLTIFKNSKPNDIEVNRLTQNMPDEVLESDKFDNQIVVHITGEVNEPGIYEFEDGSRLNDAIEKAGGFTEEADSNSVNLAKKLSDEMKIVIPSVNDIDEAGIHEFLISEDSGKININTAEVNELVELPGIGPKTADKIIEYRENNKFENIEDIKNVAGIGDKIFESIKDLIKVR
ncbi:MAG: DUF655 domain-containing protein [Tissierellia bacterium]|nr:DUF655 domain-containing protein [Tissierellia bacterium]